MASLIQKMISQSSSFRATPDEPQGHMTTIQSHRGKTKNWPVNFCNTWQAPSSGDQTITCRTKHKKNRMADCRPPSSPIYRLRAHSHRVHIWLTIRHANFASWSLIRRLTCRFSFNHLFWSLKQIILNVIFILNHDYTWHYEPEHSVLVRTCSI